MTAVFDASSRTIPGIEPDSAALAASIRGRIVSIRSPRGGGAGTPLAGGIIVTNHHVAPTDVAEVELPDGRTGRASVIGHDPDRDLALLRSPFGAIPALELRETPLRPGELVFAAGDPWGERAVVTIGTVIAAGERLVQADVRLAPGNSGGPLVDARGRVAGINAMIAGGVAVAIPASTVAGFLESLDTAPGILGVSLTPVALPRAIAAAYPNTGGEALILTAVEPSSPAARAGLLPGDVVLAVDGDWGLLGSGPRLRKMRAGKPVRLALLRGGQPVEVDAVPAPAAA